MRTLSIQERGLLILVAIGWAATGVAMALRTEAPEAATTVPPISLAGVRVVVPVFRSGPALVSINRATVEELTRLPGIGAVLAARIVAYRAEHGPFASIEDLVEVSGIGAQTVEHLRGRATVE